MITRTWRKDASIELCSVIKWVQEKSIVTPKKVSRWQTSSPRPLLAIFGIRSRGKDSIQWPFQIRA